LRHFINYCTPVKLIILSEERAESAYGISVLAGLGGGLLTGWLFSIFFGRFYSYLEKRFRPSKPRAGADR
jgi:hypothetical protein